MNLTSYSGNKSFVGILKLTFVVIALLLSDVQFVFANIDSADGRTFITNVRVEDIDSPAGTANILWDTNLPVQSLVVCGTYARAPYFYARNRDNFGYEWKTKLMKGLVTKHKVPLDGLTKGAHHCRVASRLDDNSKWVVSEEVIFDVGVGDVKSVNPILHNSTVKKEDKSEVSEGDNAEETVFGDDDNEEDGVSDKDVSSSENKNLTAISLSGIFKTTVCNNQWSVWVFVLIALLLAVVWPKELLESLSPEQTVKRLYILSVVGILTFFIAIGKSSNSWVLPVGIGTVALILATITDVLRKDGIDAETRLFMVVKTLIITFVAVLLFAFVLGWTCSILPIVIAIIGLVARYFSHNHKNN